jgi:hypothetical protein
MANLLRTPKPVSDWSDYELKAFNISIVPASYETFFGVQELPSSPFANSVILNSRYEPDNTDGLSEDEANFFFLLSADGGSALGDLTAFLLRLFGFQQRSIYPSKPLYGFPDVG